LISHKVIRYFSFLFLPIIFVSNLMLVSTPGYAALFMAQMIVLPAALVGGEKICRGLFRKVDFHSRLFPHYQCGVCSRRLQVSSKARRWPLGNREPARNPRSASTGRPRMIYCWLAEMAANRRPKSQQRGSRYSREFQLAQPVTSEMPVIAVVKAESGLPTLSSRHPTALVAGRLGAQERFRGLFSRG